MSSNATQLVISFNKSDLEVDFDAIRVSLSIILYTLTIVLGIIGNSMVIWVGGVRLKPKVTNVWLVNLAVADLIFCFTRISSLIKILFFDHWPFGDFVCKFNGFFKYANMFCSVFLLAVISLDRALCVWRPVFTNNRRTVSAARAVAVAVWALALVFSSPYFLYRQVYSENNLSKCSLDGSLEATGNNSTRLALFSIRFICGFFLPLLVIVICSILAAIGIKRGGFSGKSRSLKRLVPLVVAFFLCWAPYHCLLLVKMMDSHNTIVKIWHPIASGLAYFHSCVNPVLYFCMGLSKERKSGHSVWSVLDKRGQRSGQRSGQTETANSE